MSYFSRLLLIIVLSFVLVVPSFAKEQKGACYCDIVEQQGVIDTVTPDQLVPSVNKKEDCVNKTIAKGAEESVIYVDCGWVVKKSTSDEIRGEKEKEPENSDDPKLPSEIEELNEFGSLSVQKIIGNIIKTGMGVIGTVALIMFIYGGILWMTAAGNAEREKRAMDILIWSSLGVIVILASYAIVSFLMGAFI